MSRARGCIAGARPLDPSPARRLYHAVPPAGWQSGYAEDCKSSYSGSIPLPASTPRAVEHSYMRRIPIGLAALGFVAVVWAPLHDAAAEQDASSSRLVPGGYLQPRRTPNADPSPVLKSGLPKPRAAESPPSKAAAPPIQPRPRIARP